LSLSVLAKAKVKYQDRLRCGLQFLGLSGEQQATIRYWAERTGQRRTLADVADVIAGGRIAMPAEIFPTIEGESIPRILPDVVAVPELTESIETVAPEGKRRDRRMLIVGLLGLILGMATMAWWHWQQGWRELESQLSERIERPAAAPVLVGTEVMQRLLIHKVDPIAPLDSDGVRVKGTVILKAIISRDGSVSSLRAANGPETLVRPAMDAVRWWRFEPYRQNGEPVDVETTLAIDFQ
jgi:hypothetical protein